MTQQTTVSQALTGAQAILNDASVCEPVKSSRDTLASMRAKIQAYQPESKMTNLDYAREMFDLLEAKLRAGATYAVLAELMKSPDFDVKDGTLKTMMSKIRAERKVPRIKCPCCQSEVPESVIGAQYHDAMSAQAGAVRENAT